MERFIFHMLKLYVVSIICGAICFIVRAPLLSAETPLSFVNAEMLQLFVLIVLIGCFVGLPALCVQMSINYLFRTYVKHPSFRWMMETISAIALAYISLTFIEHGKKQWLLTEALYPFFYGATIGILILQLQKLNKPEPTLQHIDDAHQDDFTSAHGG